MAESFASFVEAFVCESETITHLAPIERVSFDSEIRGEWFSIKRISQREIDELFRNSSRKLFYPDSYISCEYFDDVHWLVVDEQIEAFKPGEDFFSESANPQPPNVEKGLFSKFPRLLENLLSFLALYDWPKVYRDNCQILIEQIIGKQAAASERERANSFEHDKPPRFFQGFRRPRIPFVLTVSNSIIRIPHNAESGYNFELETDMQPGEDAISEYDAYESAGKLPVISCHLSKDHCEGLEKLLNEGASWLGVSQVFIDDEWKFLQTALDFRARAFLADGTDELLWNITAIEAVLGEKGDGLTKRLKARIARVLHRCDKARSLKKNFDQLYDLRSDLVHGNGGLRHSSDIMRELQISTDYACGVIRWAIEMFTTLLVKEGENPDSRIDLPKRGDVLGLLDLGIDERCRLQKLLQLVEGTSEHLLPPSNGDRVLS